MSSWFILDFEAAWAGDDGVPPVEQAPPPPGGTYPPSGPLITPPGEKPPKHPGARAVRWESSTGATFTYSSYEGFAWEAVAPYLESRWLTTEIAPTPAPPSPIPAPVPAPPVVERLGWASDLSATVAWTDSESVGWSTSVQVGTTYAIERRDDDEFIAILIANDLL